MINLQVIEKPDYSEDGSIEVVDVFPTIQGEGPFVGRSAVFIRMAGCNLQCPGCDTDYTSNRKRWNPKELADHVEALSRARSLVVITGGEPFRQSCGPLTSELLNRNRRVQFETNGTLFDPSMVTSEAFLGAGLTIVCSPKTREVNKRLLPFIDYFKYILRAEEVDGDGLPTSSLNSGVRPFRCSENRDFSPEKIYVQPMDEGDEARNRSNTIAAKDSCIEFGYTLCLQVHKMIGLP